MNNIQYQKYCYLAKGIKEIARGSEKCRDI